MQNDHFSDDLSRWKPLRRELLHWFRDNATPLAEAYEGAIRLVDDGESFQAAFTLFAHAVRDISDRLVYVLDPQLKAGRVQYENEMDRIEKLWPHLNVLGPTNAATETGTVTIDYKVASIIDSLVTAHRERRERPSNYELLFRFLMRKEPLRAEVNQRLVRDFKRMREWFMSSNPSPGIMWFHRLTN